MATYPTISQFNERQLVTEQNMNDIRDALGIIRSPGRYYFLKNAGDADLTISSTTLADISASFTVASLDTSGNPVRILFYVGRHTTSATLTNINLIIDGVDVNGGTPVWRGTTGSISFMWIADGLAAGSHSYKLQWNISGAGTSTLVSANRVWYEIREE